MLRCRRITYAPAYMFLHFFMCIHVYRAVLDEADRILDLGFEKAVNAIIENLPRQRQTLLFSATQTKSVKDLARLSLKVRLAMPCPSLLHAIAIHRYAGVLGLPLWFSSW